MWKVAGIFFLFGVAALTLLVASEWKYIQRLRHLPEHPRTDIDWYQPQEIVAGTMPTAEIPTATPNEMRFRSEAISNALHYAKAGSAAAFLLLQDDKLIAEEYDTGHDPGQRTDSASMMKTVVAMLVGIAIQEGKIRSIEEPAATYLPEWGKDGRSEITIRNLLQMHSGLRPQGEYDDPFSDACYLALGTDLHYVVRHIPLTHQPGSRYDYNGVNFQALGFILERATGLRFATCLSEKLWRPVGNGDAMVWLDKKGGEARTFGYLFATGRDWARLGLLILNEGRVNGRQIVPAEWIREMCRPSPSEPTYGAGIYLCPDNPKDPPFVASDTVVLNGYGKQRVYVIPSRKLIIVRVGERPRKWNDSYLPNILVNGLLDSRPNQNGKE